MDNWMGWVIMGLCALNLLLLLGLAWVAKIALGPRHLVADGKMSASDAHEWRKPVASTLLKGAARTTEEPKKKPTDSVILMSDARDERILAADQED